MKKSLVRRTVAAVAMMAAAQGWSYTIDGGNTDVGALDQLLQWTGSLANSSPNTETNWANSILNPDTTFTLKTESVSYTAVDGGGAWAFALQSDPGYYIIKNARFWALFKNEASLDWAVFSLAGLPSGINLGGSGQLTISHVSELGGMKVPEPGSVGLIAAGLLGLAAMRRLVKG